ncbi:hypothetical protein AAGW05_03030 [Arthrobacter sp. LAPM80]|uniref:DUF6941 family protein n=1 Tax=Arthrobacter sp. LAPM80 TaxID=3141788 RepID=UPI00398AF7B9
MTDLSSASANILIADFVNIDAAGKVNIIGGGIQFLGFDPNAGMTAPFSLFVSVTVSIPAFDDTQAAVEVELVDTDGRTVTVPGTEGPNLLSFNQDVDFKHTVAPNVQQPPRGFPGCSNVVLNFPGGLPLAAGSTYEWVVLLNGSRLSSSTFFVPGVAG